ncbi:hypothetical protein L7F22_050990 [Adiantum nelumboides]|nr:hypothetical protein [Adiantum nelumboides]
MPELPKFQGTEEEEQQRPAPGALDIREQIELEIKDMPEGPAKEYLMYKKKVIESTALAFLQPEEQVKDFGNDFLPLPLMRHEANLWKEKMRPAVPRNEDEGYEDVQHWCRSCHNCQVNGNKKLLYGPRQAVIANGPFEKWGIDAMGPLPRTANGKLYILVAIDYMTRWVEAQSVAKVNEKTVSKFVYTHICCRFGTPLEIVSDNGPRFRRGLLTEVCEELKIFHRHSTPYYPQSNGLVEKANGIIAAIIRKMVESKPKRWDNFLDGAIWAYRTTYRDATQFTPFHLVYGQEALQPIELNISTIKLTGRQEQNNDEAWIDRLLSLVELEWKREAAYHCYEKKALQLKDKLNEGLKDKEIKEKSLVLRYNNALDNRFDAKFERRWEGPFIVKKAFTGGYYQLMDLNGKEHPRKVNGYRLKPYLSRILPAVFETKQVSKKTKKVCCHCCSDTHQLKSCAFQHVLKEVAKNQKENLSSPTSCPESSFQYDPVDGT